MVPVVTQAAHYSVAANKQSVIHIRDVGGEVAAAWSAGTQESQSLSAIYDLRAGYRTAVMDHAQVGSYDDNGWNNELCTYIRSDEGPFDSWMLSFNHWSAEPLVGLVGPDAQGNFEPVTILGIWEQPVTGARYKWLAVKGVNSGDVTAWCGPGKWIFIDGTRDRFESAQSGAWHADATFTGSHTTFTLHHFSWLSEHMVGWMLQPDINFQVYVPITEAAQAFGTVSVAGDFTGASAGASPINLGAQGTRFRIFAPPGTERYSEAAGMLSWWVAAASSRCLYAGYRYEAPLAGIQDLGTSPITALRRQTGENFAGQHYTLYRHYDPVLMRFTTPDPIADPWWNTGAYVGNNPAAGYDPDGLSEHDWKNRPTEAVINTVLDVVEGVLTKTFGGGTALVASGMQMADGTNAGDTFAGQQVHQLHQRRDAWIDNYGEDGVGARFYATGGIVGDMIGVTGTRESIRGRDSVTGESLSDSERYNRFVDGSSSALLFGAVVAGPKVIPWASRVGGKMRVGGVTAFSKLPNRTLRPGPYAMDSIPASSASPRFSAAERAAIDAIGYKYGCHTCGVKSPGTKTGHFVPDHQVARGLMLEGEPQFLYPHCIRCSKEQMLAVKRVRTVMKKAGLRGE